MRPGHAQPLSLRVKAKFDFDKVDASPIPDIASTQACVQSNTAALPVTRADERYLVYYRKGYANCSEPDRRYFGELSGSCQRLQRGDSHLAEESYDSAAGRIARWSRSRIWRKAGWRTPSPTWGRELGTMVEEPGCLTTPLMARAFCTAVIDTARTWLEWLAYNKNDFAEAARVLEPLTHGAPVSPWALWIQGRLAQQQNHMAEAVRCKKRRWQSGLPPLGLRAHGRHDF